MKLIPRVAGFDITPGSIKIYADKSGLELANQTVAQARALRLIVKAEDVPTIVGTAQALHKVLADIEVSRKAAKRDFLDGNKAIDDLAKKIRAPIQVQYDRLTKLLAQWHDQEARRKEAEEREKREEEERLAEALRKEAEEREKERQALLKAQREAPTIEAMHQASMDLQFFDADIPVEIGSNLEAIAIPEVEIPRAPIEGARTTKRHKFTLVDPIAAYQYDKRLVNWTLSILTAQDIVRLLKEQGLEIKIPGIGIEEFTDVTTPSGNRNG
jgi:DNA repair exonuclease SbcCD ATPase subunit